MKKIGLGISIPIVGFVMLLFLLRWLPVPTSAFMLGHLLDGETCTYQWVPWSEITPAMAIAVIASEDQNFPFHWGFDFKAIKLAIEENQNRRTPRGASTISQQVAKNLFLWSGRSWLRKGLEAIFTVAIELAWPKQRILEVYLNVAQFGPGAFGIQAGSHHHFGIPQSRLTARQAALLAAVLPNPSGYRANPPSPYVARRAAFIQRQVHHLGGVTFLKRLSR